MAVTKKKRYQYDDDLFKDTTMSFGEHLEELRVCLWRALWGLIAGFLVGLAIGPWFVDLIQTPVRRALEQYTSDVAADSIQKDGLEQEYPGALGLVEQGYYFEEQFFVLDDLRVALGQLSEDEFGVVLVSPDDLLNPRALAANLAAEKDDETKPASEVWERFSEEQRELVEKIAESSGEVVKEDRQALATALHEVADDEQPFDVELFAPKPTGLLSRVFSRGDATSATTTVLSSVDNLSPEQTRTLNRSLLSDAFGDYMRPHAPQLAKMVVWKPVEDHPRTSTKSLHVLDGFIIYMKSALVVGLLLSGPWIFYQVWMFVAAGLYPHEKNYVYFYGPISLGLFIAGALVAFFLVFAPVLDFLFSMNRWLGIELDLRINDWINFVMVLPIGFGIAFQLPLVMLFLERIGVFTTKQYAQNWRIAVMAICVISALLTPADPWSMLYMAGPLTILYWGGYALCRLLPKVEYVDDEEAETA